MPQRIDEDTARRRMREIAARAREFHQATERELRELRDQLGEPAGYATLYDENYVPQRMPTALDGLYRELTSWVDWPNEERRDDQLFDLADLARGLERAAAATDVDCRREAAEEVMRELGCKDAGVRSLLERGEISPAEILAAREAAHGANRPTDAVLEEVLSDPARAREAVADALNRLGIDPGDLVSAARELMARGLVPPAAFRDQIARARARAAALPS